MQKFNQEVVSEGRALNRVVRGTQEGWGAEPDQRHADIFVEELGLEEARPVSTPGEPEQRWEEEENAQEPGGAEATKYRALAARANYLAADRTDMMYATKEERRRHNMARPTVGAQKKLKRLGTFLAGKARLTRKYPWQGQEDVIAGYSDSDWAGCRVTG